MIFLLLQLCAKKYRKNLAYLCEKNIQKTSNQVQKRAQNEKLSAQKRLFYRCVRQLDRHFAREDLEFAQILIARMP